MLFYHVAKSGLCSHSLSFCVQIRRVLAWDAVSDLNLGDYGMYWDCLATDGSFFMRRPVYGKFAACGIRAA